MAKKQQTIKTPPIEGATIKKLRKPSAAECREFFIDQTSDMNAVLELDNGITLFVLADTEGSNWGALIGKYKSKQFYCW